MRRREAGTDRPWNHSWKNFFQYYFFRVCLKRGKRVLPSCPLITELFFFPVTDSNPVYREGNRASSTRTFLTRTFIKHEFHHLNVPLVGTVAVSDVFDCSLECLSNPLCYSVNLAVFKGTHGKLWCELLSSDKFRNSTEYKGNKSSHHFAIEVGSISQFWLINVLKVWQLCREREGREKAVRLKLLQMVSVCCRIHCGDNRISRACCKACIHFLARRTILLTTFVS